MRILLDYRPALRERTGVGHYVHELGGAVQALLPPGDELVLFSSSLTDRLAGPPIAGARTVDARIPVRVLNLAWHRLSWPPVELLAGPVDVAHAAHPLLLPARNAVQVVTIHDLDFLDHPDRTRAEIRRDYPALAARHARRADLVVVISQYTAGQVQARFGVPSDRIAVCRPGAPAFAPRDGEPPAGPILFIGTIEPRKNLPVLFEAYERLLARCPGAPPLLLAGRRVERSAGILAALETRRALAGRVRYLGYVTDEARQALYREASMLVLPSLEEGFGLTALEAMHAGVPVVASNRGALPEVIGTAGSLVDPTDAEALTAALADLLADPLRRRQHMEAGRARARTFSWRTSAQTLLAAYREAAARRGRSPRA